MSPFNLKFLSKKSKVAIGINIGSASIKIIELKKESGVVSLVNTSLMQLPPDAIMNQEIVQPEACEQALMQLADQVNFKDKSITISVEGPSTFIKKITINSVTSNYNLNEQVLWEAEQYLPFDIAEINLDYHVIDKVQNNSVDVLLVGVKKTVIQSYFDMFEKIGVDPNIVDVSLLALGNVLEKNYPEQSAATSAIIDLGASGTRINIFSNGIPIFNKELSEGGLYLTEKIQASMKCSYQEAEMLKISYQTNSPVVQALRQEQVDYYTNEIKKLLDFYHAAPTGGIVKFSAVTGGGAMLPKLIPMLEQTIQMPCQILNPFLGVYTDKDMFSNQVMQTINPLMATAAGLAYRGLE